MSHAVEGAAGGSRRPFPATATLGALGIVYGDIGTSPLYAFKEAYRASAEGGLTSQASILGVLSLLIWALILIISVKYAVLIMRADNRGEGGIVALLALTNARDAKPGTWRAHLLVVGLVGAALLYGDGAITPAISVLSAVEGLKVDAPQLGRFVVPITCVILVALFVVQHKGTAIIGRVFGPIMLGWFVAIACLGVYGIVNAPGVLAALNPAHAVTYLIHAPHHVSFAVLGAVFLAVTGGEAMYADMGHFGRLPIRAAWFGIVLPALTLNYFGQGALLMVDPSAADNPFYQLCPDILHLPLVVFATAAAVIASQAIISGAFSLTQQAIQLGFLPLMTIRHTDSAERGQIYVPAVNWTIAIATLTAVILFGSSDALAGAYGIAVSLLMAITTLLAALVALHWGYNPVMVLLVNGTFFLIDSLFFSANATKFLDGGWFPLLLSLAITFVMLTWRTGVRLTSAARAHMRQDLASFEAELAADPPVRRPGVAAFLASSTDGVPISLTHHLRHNGVLHERVLLVTVLITEEPRAPEPERVEIRPVCSGITRVILRFGFMENLSIPEGIREALQVGHVSGIDPDRITYYIGRETILPSPNISGMAVWREVIFSIIQRNAERTAAYFCVPAKQVFEIGFEIEI